MCQRHRRLSATVLDLPHVCDIAAERIGRAGLGQSVDTVAHDFRTDERLPGGYDVVLLSSVLHNWDEPTDRALLGRCRTALEPDAAVVICELLLNPERTGPTDAALMGLNMVAETQGGRNYSESQYLAWLTDAGFTEPRVIRFDAPGANGAVVAVTR
ncbi:methyltransferase [Streptomyces sp. NPDC127068]|uniref:methyltransferase n=1 Tax=Streptomyces sp. NPDC127068 TaxID=3347127 RepID=UPI0036478221